MSGVINAPAYAFTFGALNLIGSDAELAANGFRYWVLDEDGDLGTPQAIEQTIISWLQDGAIVDLTSYDNREMFLQVMVEGNSGTNLAIGEAALMLETGKANTLAYQDADPSSPLTVFSVVTSKPEPVTRPASARTNESVYGLRITAEPFVRSAAQVSVTKAAPTGTQTITSVDTCSSFTGWAATYATASSPPRAANGTKTSGVSGGTRVFAQITGPADSAGSVANFTVTLTRTGLSTSFSGNPYIRVAVFPSAVTDSAITGTSFTVNGIAVAIAVQEGNTYWLDTTGLGLGSTLNSLAVQQGYVTYKPQNNSILRLEVDDVSVSNFLGTQSTNRQLARTLAVAGSARTQGNLAVEDAANALGSVLIHTIPAVAGMVQPNLGSRLATGNARTGDSSTISGFTSDLSNIHGFDVPISGLIPGGHLLLARVKHASSGARTFTWAARSRQGSTNLSVPQTGTTSINLTAGVYATVTVARLTLPPRKMGSSGTVRIELLATGVTFDEAWIFNIETGRLTKIECGTASPSAGGAANRLFLDAPSVSSPVPSVYLGTAADRSDSFHAADELESFTVHEFQAGSMNVFTVTSNSTAASITLSHFPRWLTRAAA